MPHKRPRRKVLVIQLQRALEIQNRFFMLKKKQRNVMQDIVHTATSVASKRKIHRCFLFFRFAHWYGIKSVQKQITTMDEDRMATRFFRVLSFRACPLFL
jgi:hypothetical protein